MIAWSSIILEGTRGHRQMSPFSFRGFFPSVALTLSVLPDDLSTFGQNCTTQQYILKTLPRPSAEGILRPTRTRKQVTYLAFRSGASAATDNSHNCQQPFHRQTIRRGSCFAAIFPRSRIHQARRSTEPSLILTVSSGRSGRFSHPLSILRQANSADGSRHISSTAGCVLRAPGEKSVDWLPSQSDGRPSSSPA